MNFKRLSTFVAGPAGLIILLFFFLPWITISCSGTDILDASGMDLAGGVDENDFEINSSDFGLDESMLEDSGLDLEEDMEFESTIQMDEPEVEQAGFLDGDAKLYLIPIIGFLGVIVAAGGFFEPRFLNTYTIIGGLLLPSLLGGLIMLLKYLEISGDMSDIEEETMAESGLNILQLSYQAGWWLTIVGLIGMFAAGAVAFLTEGQPALTPIDNLETRLLSEARAHIQAKNYAEARKILRTLHNPLAEQWLQKLDEIDPFGS